MASMKADILLDFPDDGRTRKSPRLLDRKYLLVEKPSLDSFRHHTAVTLRPDIQEQIGRRSQVKLVFSIFQIISKSSSEAFTSEVTGRSMASTWQPGSGPHSRFGNLYLTQVLTPSTIRLLIKAIENTESLVSHEKCHCTLHFSL